MSKSSLNIKLAKDKIFDLAIEVMVLIMVFLLPTIFDRRLGIVFSGTKTSWMLTAGSIILGIWAIKLIVTGKHRFIRTPLDWPIISFLLCTTIATLTSVHVYTSFVGFYGRYEGLTTWYLFGLCFFVVTNYMRSFEQLKRILITVVSASTLMASYSIIQRHALDPYMWGGVITWQRVIGTIGQPNFLAAYMLMAFFLGLALLLMDNKELKTPVTSLDQLFPAGCFIIAQVSFLVMLYSLEAYNVALWYFGFFLITLAAILFTYNYHKLSLLAFNLVVGLNLVLVYISILYTQSRGGYLGLFTGLVLFAAACGRQALFKNWQKIFVLLLLIVVISGLTMLRPEYSPFARFASEVTTKEQESDAQTAEAERQLELKGAAGSRGETWKSAFRVIADNPLFGIGPEVLKMVFPRYETDLFRFREAFHVKQDRCHNEIFDVAVTKGLVTFFVYLWLLWVFFGTGLKKALVAKDSEKLLLAGILAASLAFLIQNQFSFGVVAITSLFWIMWGMLMMVGEPAPSTLEKSAGKVLAWEEIPWLAVAVVVVLVAAMIYFAFFSFRADIWFKSGKVKLEMRNLEAAAEDFKYSLNIYPFEGGTVSHLGITYLNLANDQARGDTFLNQALDTFKYGNQIDPYNADNYHMLSKVYLIMAVKGDKGALAKAKESAAIALKIDPYYAEVYTILGLIHEQEGKLDKAADCYKQAFFINPNLGEAMASLQNLYQKLGRPALTRVVFEAALKKYGDSFLVLERVAQLYLGSGQNQEALKLAQKIVRLAVNKENNKGELASGYLLSARAYLNQDKIENAFTDFQQVVIYDPKNIEAHLGLGNIYLSQGNKSRADEEFELAKRLK